MAIGWPELDEFQIHDKWEDFREEVRRRLPVDYSGQRVGAAAGQLWKFIHDMNIGDFVVVPVKSARQVMVGIVEGPYKYLPSFDPEYPRIRKVKWLSPVDWDAVPQPQRNSFFAWQTIHVPSSDFSAIIKQAEHPGSQKIKVVSSAQEAEPDDLFLLAEEAIRSKLQQISGHDFQLLAGAVMKAAGFIVLYNSAGKGKDRGIDLILAKDPLGAGDKIIVQVKHQQGPVNQPELQQLIGTLKPNEHGLLISTGSVTADAQKFWRDHRDRLMKPLEAGDFIQLLGDTYEKLESEFKAMLPLKRAYVPIVPEE